MTTENAPESEGLTLVPQQGQDSLGVDPDVEVVGHGQGQNLGQGSVIEQLLQKRNYVYIDRLDSILRRIGNISAM